jgi:lycopene cyclase domain-containing protein
MDSLYFNSQAIKHTTYLAINLFTLLGPLCLSFDAKVAYHKKWHLIPLALFLAAGPFIIWDQLFTLSGYWGFNADFLSGYYLGVLPLEEWGFFLSVPFAILFIYEICLAYKFRIVVPPLMHGLLIFIFVLLAIFYYSRPYTLLVSIFCTLILLKELESKSRMPTIWATYLLHFPGFFVVNGVLTGLPVVWYDPGAIIGIRMGSIPIEDAMYSFMLLWLSITCYEWVKTKNVIKIK